MREQENQQPFLETRLFRPKTAATPAKPKEDKNVSPQLTEGTFANKSSIPTTSIYQQQKGIEPVTENADVGTWVTVIGVIPGHTNEVLRFFSRFGNIISVDNTPGNWIYLKYASLDIAKTVVSTFNNGPQLISNNMAVTCVLGRTKSQYIQTNETIPESVTFNPIKTGIEQPRKSSISGKIFDTIFG
ncbi:hypothetical protein GPJ56_010740 [Histomonas meleagridis]|uniref:uncharacterized protein n=1 Tax=Histomonas meleagridis TaxID=135588 RepID=UPI00355A6323|nr:hypothetical protein GPJ56_010740 [Histomonas meleagridis]KAH0801076.1 hypothetical protein GO595_006111 [Histomonas meleagridis]